MEKLQKQIEVSVAERMGELILSSSNFIEKRSNDLDATFFSEMINMREMINDLEELTKMNIAISRRQELLDFDHAERQDYSEDLFELKLIELARSAKRGYKKFIEERSFEDE